MFKKELTSFEVVKASDVMLDCEVTGTAPFEVTWYKDAKEIRTSTRHTITQENGHICLHILKCGALDVGEYQCTVANDVGSCLCRSKLSLKGQSCYDNFR